MVPLGCPQLVLQGTNSKNKALKFQSSQCNKLIFVQGLCVFFMCAFAMFQLSNHQQLGQTCLCEFNLTPLPCMIGSWLGWLGMSKWHELKPQPKHGACYFKAISIIMTFQQQSKRTTKAGDCGLAIMGSLFLGIKISQCKVAISYGSSLYCSLFFVFRHREDRKPTLKSRRIT